MLRFIKHNLTSIDGVSFYPILSLLIFVVFFVLVLYFVLRMKKSDIDMLSAIPLEEDDENMHNTKSSESN